MPGGMLTLTSLGDQSLMLTGNPDKSFWKRSYKQYTHFAKQNFRLDFQGNTSLQMTSESTFTFKVKRYADLLMDCYICVNLPTIWSPIMPPSSSVPRWAPYEFRWVDYVGATIVQRIAITCGNQLLQQYSGQYLLASTQRDTTMDKLSLFYDMIGHVPELNDPANAGGRVNAYPNAFYTDSPAGAEPSIPGRTLYIPLSAWFTKDPAQSFPLVALQYNELEIQVTFRPVNEWFVIRDVQDTINEFPYVAPNVNQWYMQMHRFLHTPPDIALGSESYADTRTQWRSDIHLTCNYCFLSDEEQRWFALHEQRYLMRDIYETTYYNVTGANKVTVESGSNTVLDWMFYFQRSDARLRNAWTNYTNWPYAWMPQDVVQASTNGPWVNPLPNQLHPTLGPGVNPDGTLTGLFVTGDYTPQNVKDILVTMGIVMDGHYREELLPAGIYKYVEKYLRTPSHAPDGLYCYHFCLRSDTFEQQPSGAMSMVKIAKIQFEFTTIAPPFDPFAQVQTICDPVTGEMIGINKPTWQIYDYNFNLHLMEERFNMVVFTSGNASIMYAR